MHSRRARLEHGDSMVRVPGTGYHHYRNPRAGQSVPCRAKEDAVPMTEKDRERRIRARATRLWRADGSPKGRQAEFLERARELQAVEDNPTAGQLPNPMTQHHGEIPPTEPVEEAEIEQNLGEFPVEFTDQGDRLPTPMTKKQARLARRET
jgi:hypothetical protein